MGGWCAKPEPEMISEADNDMYEIRTPHSGLTSAGGVLIAKSISIVNQSDFVVMVFAQGDNYSLEMVKGHGKLGLDIVGGVSVSGGTETGQREKESKVSKETVPRKGRAKIRFHGQQSTNYFSLGFVNNGKCLLFLLDKPMDAGSEVTVKAYPSDEGAFIEEVRLKVQGESEEHFSYASEFLEYVKLEWSTNRRAGAAQFYRDHGEPQSMEEVMQQPENWEKFLKAMLVPKAKDLRVKKWKAKYIGCKEFFDFIGDDDNEKGAAARRFMDENHCQSMVDLVEENLVEGFLEAAGVHALKKAQKVKAEKFFQQFKPVVEQKPAMRRQNTNETATRGRRQYTNDTVTRGNIDPSTPEIAMQGNGPRNESAMRGNCVPTPSDVQHLQEVVEDSTDGESGGASMILECASTGGTLKFVLNADSLVHLLPLAAEEKEPEMTVDIAVSKAAVVYSEGDRSSARFIAFALTPPARLWGTACDECSKRLRPGADWFHREDMSDLCREHWDAEGSIADWVNLRDDAKAEKYFSSHGGQEFYDHAGDVPTILLALAPDGWDEEGTKSLEAACRGVNVEFQKINDTEELQEFCGLDSEPSSSLMSLESSDDKNKVADDLDSNSSDDF